MINPGIYPDLSNEAYHFDPAISRSGIITYLDSPYKYWANYINPNRPVKKTTDAMIFGSAFHTLILELPKFLECYVDKPPRVLLKDVGREKYEKYKKYCEYLEVSEKIVLEFDDYINLVNMKEALMDHPQAWDLIQGATYESSYFWEDEHSGLMVKSRPDILHSNIIVDLKTCNDASPKTFQNDMAKYGNYIQGAMVREGVRQLTGVDIPTVINICVEKTYPHAIGIYIIDECALEHGHQQFKQALLDIKRDIGYNKFESYPIETINLPAWAIKQ